MTAEGSPVEGTRRIDRVLAEDYLLGLRTADLAEVRELRGEAEQEEVDLSFIRRMIQGRITSSGPSSTAGTAPPPAASLRASPRSWPTSRGLPPVASAVTRPSSRAAPTATAATSSASSPTST